MKKCAFSFSLILVTIVLIAGFVQSGEELGQQKSVMSQDVMSDQHCQHAQRTAHSGEKMGTMPMTHRRSMMRRMMGGMGRMAKRACGHPMAKGLGRLGGPEMFIGHAKRLELSEDQIDQLKKIKHDQQKWNIRKKADIDVAHVELEELSGSQSVNFEKIKSKISQIADMEKEMRLAHLAAIEKAHKVLTAEQLEKARNFGKRQVRAMKKGPRQVIKEVIIEEPGQ